MSITELPSGLLLIERTDVQPHFRHCGYTSIAVLPQLIGRPFDDLARGLIEAQRPSSVRVSTDGSTKTDSWLWRVTVYAAGAGGPIERVEQEVQVGLPDGITNGYEFDVAFAKAAPPTRCERCDREDCLRMYSGTRNDGKWLCHDCYGDARMEE